MIKKIPALHEKGASKESLCTDHTKEFYQRASPWENSKDDLKIWSLAG
jgi:hypothetical protein